MTIALSGFLKPFSCETRLWERKAQQSQMYDPSAVSIKKAKAIVNDSITQSKSVYYRRTHESARFRRRV